MGVAPSSDQGRNQPVGPWAWLLPVAYAVHVVEEAFGGRGFTQWMAAGGGLHLSITEFIALNSVGISVLCLVAWAARESPAWRWLLVGGATILFVNGICHVAVCVATQGYVPGMWTGLVLYMPLGAVLLFVMRRLVPPRLFWLGVACGFIIHGTVIWMVLRMPGFELERARMITLASLRI